MLSGTKLCSKCKKLRSFDEKFSKKGKNLHLISPKRGLGHFYNTLQMLKLNDKDNELSLLEVEVNHRFKRSYRLHFVSVLHEVMVHCTLLPKCLNDGRMSLECCECKKYLTDYVIMTSQVIENGSNIGNYTFHTKIWYIVPFYGGDQ